ncbi:MAG TPA: helix-turn-helix domain-containing protein [Pyrinomonadaceae bacterium]|nr:helix-turn-helix domain-containing protein [Pyrinomonadaceae bacterium]
MPEDARELVTAATIGEQLRLAREEQQIPLRAVADETRISVHYLEAIELNDFNRLPGGIFNRSFVKAYARCVGVDEKEAVEGYTRYMREAGDTGEEAGSTRFHSVVYTDTPATRSPILTVVLAIVILAILTAAALAILNWYQRRSTVLHQQTSSSREMITGNYAPYGLLSPDGSGDLDIWKTDYEQVLQ